MKIKELYISKTKRDARYRKLSEAGRRVRRVSVRNQCLHPMYVEDFNGPEKQDTGFGNTVYKTFFKVLYGVEDI